ncbi:nucleoporin seh1-A [Artemisia annua]|uniref:Nucleoporin seh1-A n=1 Tax=Artemisia annua TaxID=35608 RepID=A0A2U1Q4V6_ARTAN|nr:nucleoporin seh1-A [Artemisia annua]
MTFGSNWFVIGYSQVWEFDQDLQRWLPVAELADAGDKRDRVYAVAWALNIGRPYDLSNHRDRREGEIVAIQP